MNIVLIGPSGAGKSTQGKRVASRLGVPYISSGEMFRAVSAEDSTMGRQVRQLMERGEYVPDGLTNEMMLTRLAQLDAREGFILDGYPRTYGQAVALDEALASHKQAVDCALLFTVPPRVLKERLGNRHDLGRIDDTADAIERRLTAFQEAIRPLTEYYGAHGKLVRIDGAQALSDVNAQVDTALHLGPTAHPR